jgi:peptide/nickel transport system permease protein/oligopeptide transport system permease protein
MNRYSENQGPEVGAGIAPDPGCSLTPNQRAWRRFRGNRPGLLSACVLALLVLAVVSWPVVLKVARLSGAAGAEFARNYSPDHFSNDQFHPPGARHWFGTDVHGRDLFSRVLYGGQISLLVGLVGAGVSLVIGVFWGAVAGYSGGRVDGVMMRVVDILYSLPSIIFVIVLITTFEASLQGWLATLGSRMLGDWARILFLFAGLGAVSWLTMARIVRGQVLSLRRRAFVDASRVLGASPWYTIRKHILPNTYGVIIVYTTLTVPAVILYESFLSYLGLGIQPPMASWGSLIAEGADQVNPIRVYWWLLACPGGVLVAALVALSLLGDALRDALAVRDQV